jgi:hypothetical protein
VLADGDPEDAIFLNPEFNLDSWNVSEEIPVAESDMATIEVFVVTAVPTLGVYSRIILPPDNLDPKVPNPVDEYEPGLVCISPYSTI